MTFEVDGNGLVRWYGPILVAGDIGVPGKLIDGGIERTLVVDFPYNSLPVPSSTNGAHTQYLPAKSLITWAQVEVLTAFVGGTSYNIGLQQSDGTVISATGIGNAIPIANLNAVGKRVMLDPNNTDTFTGALVGHVTSTTVNGFVAVVATGTFTAGKARLTIKYVPPTS